MISIPLRRYLYFTSIISGAAIMIIEILGAKMLAPYMGTSHFVWTAQIAVTLISLAAGYYLGGKIVDGLQLNHASVLYWSIFIAGVYLCIAAFACEPIAFASLRFNLPIGSLITSGFLFFIPLTCLATVGPFLIKMLTTSIDIIGSNTGKLFGTSTLGSFLGTVLIGYVLIPLLPYSVTLYVVAMVLIALSIIYNLVWTEKSILKIFFLIVTFIINIIGLIQIHQLQHSDFLDAKEIYRKNSNFGLLQVIQSKHDHRLYYLNDFITLNDYDPIQKQGMTIYTSAMEALALAYTPKIEDVLCIGLGAGIVPMNFSRRGAKVEIIEINPAIMPIAQKYFGCESEKFHLVIADGRAFLNQTNKSFDVIILDAFLGESAPSHLMTRQAFLAMQRGMKSDATLVINTIVRLEEGKDFFAASIEKTLKTVFRHVRVFTEGNGNVFFTASDREIFNMINPLDFDFIPTASRDSVKLVFKGIVNTNPTHGIILTDDYHPVEFYDAPNQQNIHRERARAMAQQITQ